MASVGTYFCLIAFFFFSEIVILSPVLAARNMGEASLLPPLPSSTHNFLEQCAAKLPVECGVEIVGTLFGDGTLTASCCSNLVAVGRPCHDVLAKSEKLWNDSATKKPSVWTCWIVWSHEQCNAIRLRESDIIVTLNNYKLYCVSKTIHVNHIFTFSRTATTL